MRRRTTRVGPALLILLPLLPFPADAQEGVSLHVDEFRGYAWGTPMSEIIDSLGDAARVDTLEEGMIVLVYPDTYADAEAIAMYALLGDEGLVKGQQIIPFDENGNGEAEFSRLRSHGLLKYPMIVPEVTV